MGGGHEGEDFDVELPVVNKERVLNLLLHLVFAGLHTLDDSVDVFGDSDITIFFSVLQNEQVLTLVVFVLKLHLFDDVTVVTPVLVDCSLVFVVIASVRLRDLKS